MGRVRIGNEDSNFSKQSRIIEPAVVYIDRIVEVPVEKRVEVPVYINVEKLVPFEQEKIVHVDRIVEKIVEVEVTKTLIADNEELHDEIEYLKQIINSMEHQAIIEGENLVRARQRNIIDRARKQSLIKLLRAPKPSMLQRILKVFKRSK